MFGPEFDPHPLSGNDLTLGQLTAAARADTGPAAAKVHADHIAYMQTVEEAIDA